MDFNCAVLLLFGVSIIAATDNVTREKVKRNASQKNLVQPRVKQPADKLSSVNNTIQPRTKEKAKGKAGQKNLVQLRIKQPADALGLVNNTIQPRMACSSQNCKYFMIKHKKSGLVLDASNDVVKIQTPTRSTTQLRSLEMAGLGKVYIVNHATENVLDIKDGVSKLSNEVRLITYPKHCGPNQQWLIHRYDYIWSVVEDFVVDIWHEIYDQGNDIVVYSWIHGKKVNCSLWNLYNYYLVIFKYNLFMLNVK